MTNYQWIFKKFLFNQLERNSRETKILENFQIQYSKLIQMEKGETKTNRKCVKNCHQVEGVQWNKTCVQLCESWTSTYGASR